jgi:hypothetical protein
MHLGFVSGAFTETGSADSDGHVFTHGHLFCIRTVNGVTNSVHEHGHTMCVH